MCRYRPDPQIQFHDRSRQQKMTTLIDCGSSLRIHKSLSHGQWVHHRNVNPFSIQKRARSNSKNLPYSDSHPDQSNQNPFQTTTSMTSSSATPRSNVNSHHHQVHRPNLNSTPSLRYAHGHHHRRDLRPPQTKMPLTSFP